MAFNARGKIINISGSDSMEGRLIITAEMKSGFLKGPITIETDKKYWAENMKALGLELPRGGPWPEEKQKKHREAKKKIINHNIDIIIE
ncbi:hypothetical protein KY346_03240 [Candidatus Woesearchaeota archaeon]|nr:hypothetical protein [Candidatus Woesearchaeota archaeon]